jgi:two-component system, NtrC family, sensor kinase
MRPNERNLFRNSLIIGAAMLPAMLYAIVLRHERSAVLDAAQDNIRTTMQIFEANTHRLLETDLLISSLINQHIRGMTWEHISQSEALHDFLAGIVRAYPSIYGLSLIDANGHSRSTSTTFPSPANISFTDRDYFIALREADRGFYIGKPVYGRFRPPTSDDVYVNLVQRRSSEDGQFDGVIVLAVRPTNFMDYWNKAPHKPGSALVIRADGQPLVRDPPLAIDAPPYPPDNVLMQRINAGSTTGMFWAVSSVDQHERLYGYRKIENFPVYIGYGTDIDAVLDIWYQHIWMYGVFFAVGTIGLVVVAMLAGNRLQRWQNIAHELTEEIGRRERAEAQLQQSQKLEAIGHVAGQIAHDFGNILGIIVASLDMLARNQDQEKFLTMAQRAAERGTKAVQTLLAFARRQPEQIERFDLNVALLSLADLLRQAVGGKIKLSVETPESACWIKVSRNQTELAILNIMVNARDALPDGGQIMAVVGRSGEYVTLAISDTGCGMPEDVVARVFEPFYTTKPTGRGTGLGLSMVYDFAKRAGGMVHLTSQPGAGTTVTLMLPFSPP